MSICEWLVVETLGSRPIMPKNLPGHCLKGRPDPCLSNFVLCQLVINHNIPKHHDRKLNVVH